MTNALFRAFIFGASLFLIISILGVPSASPHKRTSELSTATKILFPDTAQDTPPLGPPEPLLPPEISAAAYGIWDIESDQALLSHRTSESWPIASLTKLLTAAVALTYIPPATPVQFTETADLTDSAHISLLPSGEYRAADLISAMLIASDNGSAEALAEILGRDAFVEKLNQLASSWGMRRTRIADPTGLSVENQSTADDLKILARHVWNTFPEIFEITRSIEGKIETDSEKVISVPATHKFAGTADFLGGKTGYTDASKGNLMSLFLVHGRPIMVLVLGAEDRFEATAALHDWLTRDLSRTL